MPDKENNIDKLLEAAQKTEGKAEETKKEPKAEVREEPKPKKQNILDKVREDDDDVVPGLTLRRVLGGDILTADMVRKQIWLFVLIVVFTLVYVAFRYQCQQDMITIDKMERELLDAKYKALSSSSKLTEKCRESHVLEYLKQNKDSMLRIADQPPYIIYVPEKR